MASLNLFLFTLPHAIFLVDSLGGDVLLTHDNTLCYQHSLSGSAKVKPFDPKVTCKQECLITTFQEVYFVSESFEEAKEKMREFAKTIKRPFGVKYNPYTQSVQILKDTKSIASVVNELRHELDIVSDALSKMGKQLEV